MGSEVLGPADASFAQLESFIKELLPLGGYVP